MLNKKIVRTFISHHTKGSRDSNEDNNKVRLISSPLLTRPVLQIAKFEEETTMSADRGSNFVAVGDRNRAENSRERGKSVYVAL